MKYKLISINTVISKVVRDLGLGTDEIPWQDFIEWTAEGLNHIGAHSQYESKIIPIPIANYVGELPCDFYMLSNINHYRPTTEIYNAKTQEEIQAVIDNMFEIRHNIPLYYWPALSANFMLMDKINYNRPERFTEQPNTEKGNRNSFTIHNGRITVGFQCGFVEIQYLSLPVDCDGYPLVPDSVDFFDALFWKIVYQLSIRGYTFPNTQLNDVQFTRSMWLRYCGQARADSNMMDPIEQETFKNNFLKLIPNFYPERTEGRGIYDVQRLNLNGKG